MSLKIGKDVIEPEDHAKLLGITFDNNKNGTLKSKVKMELSPLLIKDYTCSVGSTILSVNKPCPRLLTAYLHPKYVTVYSFWEKSDGVFKTHNRVIYRISR